MRKERERARKMIGPIVFLHNSELTTGWGIFSCCTPFSFSFPLPACFLNNLSPNLSSLNKDKLFPLFLPHYWFHFLCSKSYGCWHLLSPWTPSPLHLLRSLFFSFVRQHIWIFKSELTTAHSPKTSSELLQAALQLFSGLWHLSPSVRPKKSLKSQTHASRETNKVWKEENWKVFGWIFEGRMAERGFQFKRNLKSLLSQFLNRCSLAASL